jgi:APA family basic amino acid/polyamine antiporter
MGKDMKQLKFLATSNRNGVPYVAVILQSVISIVLVLSSSFESLITYVGFTLNLFTFLTVMGVFILRTKFKDLRYSYKTPGYPITPILFLLINCWILFFIFMNKTTESLFGLGTVALCFLFYWIGSEFSKKNKV